MNEEASELDLTARMLCILDVSSALLDCQDCNDVTLLGNAATDAAAHLDANPSHTMIWTSTQTQVIRITRLPVGESDPDDAAPPAPDVML